MHFAQARKKIKLGDIARVYLLIGDDNYSKKKFLDELRDALESNSKQAVSLEYIEDLDPNTLTWYLNQGSLIAEKRVLIINSPPYQEKSSKDQLKLEDVFMKQLQTGDENSEIIVFDTVKVDRRKKIVKVLEKRGCFIDFNPLRGQALYNSLQEICRGKGITPEKESLEELVLRKGEDLNTLEGELEKISLFLGSKTEAGNKKLSVEVVRKLAAPHQEANIFQLVEAVGKQEALKALKMLKAMLKQKEPPPLILFMLARHYRLLLQTISVSEDKKTPGYLAKELSIPPRAAASLLAQSQLYTRETLAKAFALLTETDYQVKKGKKGGDAALEILIWKLSLSI